MSKRELFSFAGIATCKKNITKVRYTNNLQNRLIILYRDKFTNINFVELPTPMTKKDASKYLLTLDSFKNFENFLLEEIKK